MENSRLVDMVYGVIALVAAAVIVTIVLMCASLSSPDRASGDEREDVEATVYDSIAVDASEGPIYNLPDGFRQTVVVDRSNRAYIMIESDDGGIALSPYLGADGEQVVIPQS